jgi:hypothetical protein
VGRCIAAWLAVSSGRSVGAALAVPSRRSKPACRQAMGVTGGMARGGRPDLVPYGSLRVARHRHGGQPTSWLGGERRCGPLGGWRQSRHLRHPRRAGAGRARPPRGQQRPIDADARSLRPQRRRPAPACRRLTRRAKGMASPSGAGFASAIRCCRWLHQRLHQHLPAGQAGVGWPDQDSTPTRSTARPMTTSAASCRIDRFAMATEPARGRGCRVALRICVPARLHRRSRALAAAEKPSTAELARS